MFSQIVHYLLEPLKRVLFTTEPENEPTPPGSGPLLTLTRSGNQNGQSVIDFCYYFQIPISETEGDASEHALSLSVDETRITTPNSILRYLAKTTELDTDDALEEALLDQWLELHTEFLKPLEACNNPQKFGIALFQDGHERRCKEHVLEYLKLVESGLNSDLSLGSGDVSVADFCWFPTLERVCGEHLDEGEIESFEDVSKFMEKMRKMTNRDSLEEVE
jgi:hypothetical protein